MSRARLLVGRNPRISGIPVAGIPIIAPLDVGSVTIVLT